MVSVGISPLTASSSLFSAENKRDILFLFDGSANLVGQFPAVRDFLYKIIDELDVKPDGIRVAVAQYSDDVRLESRFNEHMTKPEILNLVKRMKIKTGKMLNLGYALDFAQRYIFVKTMGSRIEDGVMQVLVLLVAGKSSDSVDVPARNLKQSGVIPFVFQAKNADPAELEQIVLSPVFILAAESLPKIGELQPQIVNLLKSAYDGGGQPPGTCRRAHPGRARLSLLTLGPFLAGEGCGAREMETYRWFLKEQNMCFSPLTLIF